MRIREMKNSDLQDAAEVHGRNFVRQEDSVEWLRCNLNASPRFYNLVAELDGRVIAYIIWNQKSGFRAQAVVELEQLAVLPELQGQGIGRALIVQSLEMLKQKLHNRGAKIKHILVSTRTDNLAQKLYQSTLNAQVEYTLSNLYSADEVLMIARNIDA